MNCPCITNKKCKTFIVSVLNKEKGWVKFEIILKFIMLNAGNSNKFQPGRDVMSARIDPTLFRSVD